MIDETTLQPGKVRTSKYGLEIVSITIKDRGVVQVCYDLKTQEVKLAVHDYDNHPKMELVSFSPTDGVLIRF